MSSAVLPLPERWFPASLRGGWIKEILLGCALFPIVSTLNNLNSNMMPIPSNTLPVSPWEQSLMSNDLVSILFYVGGISGCAHLGGDDLPRIPAAVHHQVFPGRRRGSAELVDIRAGAFQHGASHPLTFSGCSCAWCTSAQEHSRTDHPAQPVERVRLRRAHLEAGRVVHVALRFCSLARLHVRD